MPTPNGLLLVMMETALTDDDEFNAWYDSEHIPERAAVPGFLSACRYVCRSGFPRYLAVYDLESLSVLQSPGYRAIGGENLSIWTKRVQRNTRGRWRLEGVQVHPGNAVTKHLDRRCHLTVVRFLGAREAALLDVLRGYAEEDSNIEQFRLYRNEAAPGEHGALFEHRVPVSGFGVPAAFLRKEVGRIDLINTYAPYWR
jgi:hypothetical protein